MKGATFYIGVLFRVRPFPACNRERRMNVRKTRLPTMAEVVAKRELGAVCNLTCWRDQDRAIYILSLRDTLSSSGVALAD